MAKIGLPKGSGKQLKVSEKSGNFETDIVGVGIASENGIVIYRDFWVCIEI